MSSAFIPKEKLSAYQRWELSNFDAQSQERVHEGKDQLEKNDELLRVAREQAQREGFDAGYQSGAAEAAAQTALFARLAEEYHTLNRSIHRMETNVEPADDATIEGLKKKRLNLKDEISKILDAA